MLSNKKHIRRAISYAQFDIDDDDHTNYFRDIYRGEIYIIKCSVRSTDKRHIHISIFCVQKAFATAKSHLYAKTWNATKFTAYFLFLLSFFVIWFPFHNITLKELPYKQYMFMWNESLWSHTAINTYIHKYLYIQ